MKKTAFIFGCLSAIALLLNSCKNDNSAELKNGIWRATLKTRDAAEIPFNFEVSDSTGKKDIKILNGKEKFDVDEITLSGDSVIIKMPLFDSEIRAAVSKNNLSGKWVKHLANADVEMQFSAEHGQDWRFFKASPDSLKHNVQGKWSSTFISNDGADTTIAVGEFKQTNGIVTGTFLTTTGDYRFLAGTVSEDKLYLSCFDGGHAFLFTGKFANDSTIVDGKFYSGFTSVENWIAKKDDRAILPDAYSLTGLKPGYKKIDFTFLDLNHKNVSLSDPKFKDKVVLVQFFGSWCPNCMDETAYLAPFYKKYKSKGVEIVGLAYERTPDFDKSKANVERLRKRFDVTYDMLLTGFINDKQEVAKSLPMLNNFVAFPTLIIIDKKGMVRKIHTGFSGPGTGEHYTEFVDEFERTITNLLAEN